MIVECPTCQSTVDAEVIATHVSSNVDLYGAPYQTSFIGCPRCDTTMVTAERAVGADAKNELVWDTPVRVFPGRQRQIASIIPAIVGNSLEEADVCFRARAYSACAVMCGRALEGMCRHFNTKSRYLGGGLEELRERQIIEERLFKWSQELQRHRNLGAHASEVRIPREDAQDLLHFVSAITEYVFVLTDRFEKFMARRSAAGPTGPT